MPSAALFKSVETTPPAGADEVVGTVDQVRYRDADTLWSVLVLSSRVVVKLEYADGEIEEGRSYRFLGGWTDHAKYGRSFRADVWVLNIPAYQKGVVDYLTEFAPGIGTRRAAQLWETYGGDAVAVLRGDPARVARETDIPFEDAETAGKALAVLEASEAAKLAVYRLLNGRGFPRKTAKLAHAKWGDVAAGVLERNPLALMVSRFPGCGFRRADRLYADLGHPPDKLKRQTLAAWDTLRRGADGSTWVLAEDVEDETVKLIGPKADPGRAVRLGVRAGWLAERTSETGTVGRYLADGGQAADERMVAGRIRQLSARPPAWPDLSADDTLYVHQRAELAKALAGPVGLLLGTPGTGKTHVAGRIIRAALADAGGHRVAVCAPTGKAAVRITAAVRDAVHTGGVAATTIHKLLDYRPGGFGRHRGNPLHAQFVIVDEASMLDCTLAARLLDACAPGTHVLFVGDPYQLPPVGHGAPLRDFQAAGLPCGLLTEVVRNGGLITAGCARIKDRLPPKFCARVDLPAGDNLRLAAAATTAEAVDVLIAFLGRVRARNVEEPELPDAVWQTQVIVANNRKSGLSRKAVNGLLQTFLNSDGMKVGGMPFRVGDKVICLRNGWYTLAELNQAQAAAGVIGVDADDWRPKRDADDRRDEAYVANGEIGGCVAVARAAAVFQFEAPGRTVKVGVGAQATDDDDPDDDAGGQKGLGCQFDLAYAVTCHKGQGSQWPYVVVLADPAAGMVASQEWWYTALSRAETLCLVIGTPATVEKQIRRRTLHIRKTFLKDLLAELRT